MSFRYIFNTSGEYSAFIIDNYLFTKNVEWLGIIINGNEVFNTDGYYVGLVLDDDRIARNKTHPLRRIPRPQRPPHPPRPQRPMRRLRMLTLPNPYEDVFEKNAGNINKLTPSQLQKSFLYLLDADIIASDETYLGKISFDKFEQNSIANPYGDFGSKYSELCIFNSYGVYGSRYSDLSPFNPYSQNPPKIFLSKNLLGYLTANSYHIQRIDTIEFVDWFKNQTGRNDI
jgi:hypothetical protein